MAFIQAFYHLATGGFVSFTIELVTGTILGVSLWLSYSSGTRAVICRRVERGLLVTIAVILMAIGVYHGTHQGYTSGTLQPLAAILLGYAVYLSYTAEKQA